MLAVTTPAQRAFVASPNRQSGGVQTIARELELALTRKHLLVDTAATLPELLSRRSVGPLWFALTWKTYLAVLAGTAMTAHGGACWVHGAEVVRDSRAWRVPQGLVFRHAKVLLAASPFAAELASARAKGKVKLVGPVVSGSLFTAIPKRDEEKIELRLVSIGRAVPRKGHDTAIRVAKTLAARYPVSLTIVGSGPDVQRLRALASRVGPNPHVAVMGYCTPDVKRGILDNSDVLLFLARNEGKEFDGLGLVVLEAAARGCPAVVLDMGGTKYSVQDGRTGSILPSNAAIGAIADATITVSRNHALRVGARRFANEFAPDVWVERVLAAVTGAPREWQWPFA